MNYDTEIDKLFGLFVNEDSYFPMFQRLGINMADANPTFKKSLRMEFFSTRMK